MVKTLKRKNTLTRMLVMLVAWFFVCGMGQRGSAPPPELKVDVLLAGTQGNGSQPEPSTKWITSREELEQLLVDQKSSQLPAQDLKPAVDVDFTAVRILLVRMGQKPTAGYNLQLDPESCIISKETANISLVWIEPAPDMVAAQVITNPFILLKISKGGYDSVKIVDQHGQTRVDLSVGD